MFSCKKAGISVFYTILSFEYKEKKMAENIKVELIEALRSINEFKIKCRLERNAL